MAATNSFRDRDVWRESMLLVEDVYGLSRTFPADERFGLTSQIRRAAVSIPSNIAEGNRRKRLKPYLNHLDIALGSQAEVDVQLELACRLAYVSVADHEAIAARTNRVGRMLNGLINSLQQKDDGWS